MKFVLRIIRRVRTAWGESLRLRMVAVSVGFSLVAVILIGWLLSFTIEQNLFETRRLEVVSETQAVSGTVQAQLDDAIDAQGSIDVESANGAVQATIRATISLAL